MTFILISNWPFLKISDWINIVTHKMSIIVIMIIHVVFIMSAFYPSIIGDGIFVFLIAILFKGVILFLN